MRRGLFLLFMLSFYLTGCAELKPPLELQEQLGEPVSLIIDNVSTNQKTIDITRGEKVIIKYRLSASADTVDVTFYNSVNMMVKKMEYSSVPEGENTITWDGATESDVYTYVIKARKEDRYYTYNPSVTTGNKDLEIEKAYIVEETHDIIYVLPNPSWVRIRLGLRDSALLNTIMDWTPQEAGRHQLKWSGWDKNNLIQISKDPNTALAIEAISLPMNSVIIKGHSDPDYLARYKYLISGEASSYPMPIDYNLTLREPEFTITLAEEYPVTEDNIPIVNGMVPVTVTISPEDRDILVNSRYEIMFYVDTIFLYEDEQAYTPFTYMWDTNGLEEGPHIFTVNLLGYNMGVGIDSIKVYVKNEE